MHAPSLQDNEKAADGAQARAADASPGLAGRLKDALSSAQASSNELATRAGFSLRGMSDGAAAGFGRARTRTGAAMGKHPWRSAMLIGMAGLVLGALFNSNSRHR